MNSLTHHSKISCLESIVTFQGSPKPKRKYHIPLLGGSVRPGMLYNGKEDKPIYGNDLFYNVTVTEAKVVNTDFKVFAETSYSERMTLLNIEASLSLSFMGGLIEVESNICFTFKCYVFDFH